MENRRINYEDCTLCEACVDICMRKYFNRKGDMIEVEQDGTHGGISGAGDLLHLISGDGCSEFFRNERSSGDFRKR